MKPIISPSILSADFGNLARDIDMLNRSEADWLHIDIMDGVFVPNISFGFPVLKHVAKLAKKPLDVHLMIVQPEKFIAEVKALGTEIMNVHYETCPHLHRVVQQIREAGMKPAVTINPATPVILLKDIVHEVDMVLVMGVNPGFGGQKFIENTVEWRTEIHREHSGKSTRTARTYHPNRFKSIDRSGWGCQSRNRCPPYESWSRRSCSRKCCFFCT